jgi:DNA-binding SARP family transcriptional activator
LRATEEAHSSRRLAISLFGALTIEDGRRTLGPADLGGVRPKQVLEILLAARGHRVPTERIAELLWGAERPKGVGGSIQTFVSVLRRRLTDDRDLARRLVVTEVEAYRLASDLIDLDLDCFDELLERAAGEPTRLARRSLEQALELASGEVLEDEPYAGWAEDLRNTYKGRVLGARVDAAGAALADLDYRATLGHAQVAIMLDPYSERAHRQQMLALYALGRQHEALDAYRSFRRRLDDELGLEPTPETRALEAAILRHEDVRLLLPRPVARETASTAARPVRLLGRAEELARIDRGIRRALDGSCVLILVEGEPGIGRTRLLDELADTIDGARRGRATCSPLEWHLPYVPLGTALREALAEVSIDATNAAVSRILPELTPEKPVGFADVEVLEALVELVSEHAPLVLLLDDLQSADPATIGALSYLHHRCADVPLAIVATISDGQPAHHPTHRLEPDLRVRLEPLTASELAPLGMPTLHESTGGHPQLIAKALAGGCDHPLAVALTETLLGRCRAEGPDAYRILLTASVLEQPFEPEPLAEVVGMDAAQLVEELERLCERRILRVDGPRFRFRYALIRDVLLANLSPARVRILRARLDRTGERPVLPLRRAQAGALT